MHQRLQIGAEYNPVAEEVGPLVTFFLLTEGDRQPALFLGTSSDRIGSPAGKQSYYLTASKLMEFAPVSVYTSLNYSEWDEAFNVPFGANAELGYGTSARLMYDGQRTHLMGSYFWNQYSLSLIYVWLEQAGVSLSIGF